MADAVEGLLEDTGRFEMGSEAGRLRAKVDAGAPFYLSPEEIRAYVQERLIAAGNDLDAFDWGLGEGEGVLFGVRAGEVKDMEVRVIGEEDSQRASVELMKYVGALASGRITQEDKRENIAEKGLLMGLGAPEKKNLVFCFGDWE